MLYNLALLLPCSICLFGALWLACKKESNTKAQNLLALSFLLSSVFFFCTANYIAGVPDYATYRRLDILDCFVTPFIIPTMYLYFRSLTYEGAFTWKEYLWFLPAFVVGVGNYVLYLAMDEVSVARYVQSVLIDRSPNLMSEGAIYKLHYLISIKLYTLIALVQMLGTTTLAVINLKRYHYRLREFYSALEDKSIDLDNKILCWFLLVIPFAFGIILVEEAIWSQYPVLTSFYFAGYAAVYFGICYYGSQRKYTIENLSADLEQADLEAVRNCYDLQEDYEADKEDYIPNNRYVRHLALFNKLMDEDRIFLQSSLRADELSSIMCTNRTYLSQMLKAEFQCTFSDYINRKRVEYSQELMRKDPDLKLWDLSTQSGFSNVNSFGRTFKQVVGIPPKEWLKSHILQS